MTIYIEPVLGVPYDPKVSYDDLFTVVTAACNSRDHANKEDCIKLTTPKERVESEIDDISDIVRQYAENPTVTHKEVRAIGRMSDESLVMVQTILQDFGRIVVREATAIRHLIVNKLILETENPDPRVRLRALEMLGKISDVGIFTERSEVTVNHQSADDIRSKLRDKLQSITKKPAQSIEDAVIVEKARESV